MNNTVATIAQQIGGINQVHMLTGAKFITSENELMLFFPKMVGKTKFNKLKIAYNYEADLYNVTACKYSRKTLTDSTVAEFRHIYCDQLRDLCEQMTGLYFTFNK